MADIHRIADEGQPALRRAWAFAVARAIRQTAFPRLAAAIEAQSIPGVIGAIEWQAMGQTLGDGIIPALTEIMTQASRVQKAAWVRVDNPRARIAAARQSYDLIQGVTEESKLAIRALLERLFSGQSTVQATGRLIRDHIGLTRGQSASLWNYQEGLQEDFVAGRLDMRKLVQLVSRKRDDLIAHRAEMIARTESMKAANQGQYDSWLQAEAEGLIQAGAQREWLVADSPCEICDPVPVRGPVGLSEPFILGDGSALMNPPAHPACKCSVALLL